MNRWVDTIECTFLCVSKIKLNCLLKEKKIEEMD